MSASVLIKLNVNKLLFKEFCEMFFFKLKTMILYVTSKYINKTSVACNTGINIAFNDMFK